MEELCANEHPADRTPADRGLVVALVGAIVGGGAGYELVGRFLAPLSAIGARAAVVGVVFIVAAVAVLVTRSRWKRAHVHSDAERYEREQHLSRGMVEAEAEAAARYRALMDGLPAGVIVVGSDGLVESWNEAARRLFGHDAQMPIGAPVTALMPGVRARVTTGGGLALADFMTGAGTVMGQCSDGTWAELTIRVRRNSGGGYLVFVEARRGATRKIQAVS